MLAAAKSQPTLLPSSVHTAPPQPPAVSPPQPTVISKPLPPHKLSAIVAEKSTPVLQLQSPVKMKTPISLPEKTSLKRKPPASRSSKSARFLHISPPSEAAQNGK